MIELTHKQKVQAKKELKENLFFHLRKVWTRSHTIELNQEIMNCVWSIVTNAMQTSYSKGYTTGIKNGQTSEVVKVAGREMIKLRKHLTKQNGCSCKREPEKKI